MNEYCCFKTNNTCFFDSSVGFCLDLMSLLCTKGDERLNLN